MALFGLGKTPEQRFWDWFQKNENRLFNLEQSRERLFGELQVELQTMGRDLTFEFSSVLRGKREFVVSAGGVVSAFPAVERLVDCAPSLPRWVFVKFRQRRDEPGELRCGDSVIRTSEVEVAIGKKDGKIALVAFIPNVYDNNALAQIAFLFLDAALGEYDVSMKVGAIEFYPFAEHSDYPRFPLAQLPARFDRAFKKLTES